MPTVSWRISVSTKPAACGNSKYITDPAPDIQRLRHMVSAADEALTFMRGKGRKDLAENRILTLAVIKDIEIIGEAASRMSDEFKEVHSEIPWNVLVGTRIRLIHGYYDIDIVWATVTEDLPTFTTSLKRLLRQVT
jgi:uncharacterized protein with HEPN domain